MQSLVFSFFHVKNTADFSFIAKGMGYSRM